MIFFSSIRSASVAFALLAPDPDVAPPTEAMSEATPDASTSEAAQSAWQIRQRTMMSGWRLRLAGRLRNAPALESRRWQLDDRELTNGQQHGGAQIALGYLYPDARLAIPRLDLVAGWTQIRFVDSARRRALFRNDFTAGAQAQWILAVQSEAVIGAALLVEGQLHRISGEIDGGTEPDPEWQRSLAFFLGPTLGLHRGGLDVWLEFYGGFRRRLGDPSPDAMATVSDQSFEYGLTLGFDFSLHRCVWQHARMDAKERRKNTPAPTPTPTGRRHPDTPVPMNRQ